MNGLVRNHDFFGRDHALSQIDAFLFPESRPPGQSTNDGLRSVVICGMGGIGKTEIAAEYAFSRKEKFDAIFWVNADTKEKLNYGFNEMARTLELEHAPTAKDDVTTRGIVKRWLSKPIIAGNSKSTKNDQASWLLVLDNADEPDKLEEFWPKNGNGCVIVTSRNPLSKDIPSSPNLDIDLTSFSRDDAGRLLQSLSQREYEADSLNSCIKIAETLGGLPLAITQMGGIIRRRHLSLDDFVSYYEEDARKLHEMSGFGQSQSYKQTISSVWMLEALSKSALALLQILSFLDPDRIQESILVKDTKGVELPDYPKSRVAYFDARTELIQSSLVARDIRNNELRIHRLVQDVVRERLTREETQLVFESTIALLSNSWPFIDFDERNELTRLNKCKQLFRHAEKIRSLFEGPIRSGDSKPSSASAAFFNEVAWYMTEKADDETMGIYASLSLDVLKNVEEDKFRQDEKLNRLLSQTHQYIAVSCIFTDTPGALDHLKSMISLIIERMEKWNRESDAIQLADSYNESAMALMREANREDQAIRDWQRSYDAFGAIPGSTKIQQEWPAIHLALIYALQGEWQKGDDILLPVLMARDEKFGKDSTDSMVTGKVLHVFGDLRRAQGNFDEALDMFQRALFIFRATIGDNHYITADCCYRLAQQLIRTDRNDEASRLLDQSLKVYKGIRWYKPQAARSAFMKGRLLKNMGNDVEGDAQLERAMKLRKEIVPDDDRTWNQLTDEDFDVVVWYYSR